MRSLIFAASLALIAPGASAAPSDAGRLEFDVTRNGQPFGRHTVTVSADNGDLRAHTSVMLRANVGPLTVYRMEQTCTETWRDGALAALDCATLKDGRRTRINARIESDRLRVSGAGGEHWFSRSAFPTSWWTRPPPQATTLIDTETGAPMQVRITPLGREMIEVGGARIAADRVRVQGTLTVDLWYDERGRWVGCRFTARGQTIEYRLATPLTSAPA